MPRRVQKIACLTQLRAVQPQHAPMLASAPLMPMYLVGLFYGAMAAAGAALSFAVAGGGAELRALATPLPYAAALAGAAALVAASALGERWSESVRNLGRQLAHGIAPLTLPRILFFAAASGLAEEALFRGPIQYWLGMWPTAVVFGLAHGGLRRGVRSWTWFAFAAGILLGGLREWSGSLWPSVVCHVVVNAVNMLRLRRYAPLASAAVDP